MALSSKIKVGVLRGGPSREHEISLKTGSNVLKNMPDGFSPVDIFIDKTGVWYIGGVAQKPEKIFRKVDVLWNALHGEFGEDGALSLMLDSFGVPYTGSGHLASAFAMHKGNAKKMLSRRGIKSPYNKIIKKNSLDKAGILEFWRMMPNPVIVKPMASGSSLGVSVAKNFAEFEIALEKAFSHGDFALVEEFLNGKEATCGVIDGFRGRDTYALLPVELVVPASSRFLDYEGKYGGKTQSIHPGRFSSAEKEALQNMALTVHQILGLRHYSRSDFIITPKRGIYFLEANSLPGLYAGAPFTESVLAVGATFSGFLEHVLRLALDKK